MSVKFLLFGLLFVSTQSFAAGGAKSYTNLFPPKQPQSDLATPPPSPQLLEPATFGKLSAGPLSLKWSDTERADHYHVQVATDPNFKWLVADQNMIKATEFSFEAKAATTYYWRVAAIKSNNEPTHRKSNFTKAVFETN